MTKVLAFVLLALSLTACDNQGKFLNCLDGCLDSPVAASPQAQDIAVFAGVEGLATSPSLVTTTTCIDLSALTEPQVQALRVKMRNHAISVGGQSRYWMSRFEGNDKSYSEGLNQGLDNTKLRAATSDLVSTEYRNYVTLGGTPITIPAKLKKSAANGCTNGRIQSVHGSMVEDYEGKNGVGSF